MLNSLVIKPVLYGHAFSRGRECICRRMLRVELASRRLGGRAERGFMEVMKLNMKSEKKKKAKDLEG